MAPGFTLSTDHEYYRASIAVKAQRSRPPKGPDQSRPPGSNPGFAAAKRLGTCGSPVSRAQVLSR